MTFKTLLEQYSFDEIAPAFKALWQWNAPKQAARLQLEDWRRIYQSLKETKTTPSHYYIRLGCRWESCTPMIDMPPTQPENTLSAKTGHNDPPPPQPSSNMSSSELDFRYRCGYVSKTSFASKTDHDSARLKQSSDFALGLHHLSIEELLCLQLSGYSSRQIITASLEEAEHWKDLAAKASAARDKAKRILDKQAQAGVTTIP